jgi:hypothetical protein
MSELYFISAVFAHSKAPSINTIRNIQELLELMYVETYMTQLHRFGEVQEVIHDLAYGFYESIIYSDNGPKDFNIDLTMPEEDVRTMFKKLVNITIRTLDEPEWCYTVYDEILSQIHGFITKTLEYNGMITDIRYTPLTPSSGLLTVYIDIHHA